MSDGMKIKALAPWLAARVSIDPVSGCWNWQRCRNGKGYGRAGVRGTAERFAHRIAYVVHVNRATAFFMSCWMGRNGYCGLKKMERGTMAAVRWTPNGGHGGQRFANAIDSIPDWHHRLRRALILRRDGFELLDQIDDHPKVAIYCDPPYLEKSDQYLHDFESCDGGMFGDDHRRLADALQRFERARVVVSYYDHPRLAELYPGWTKRTFDVAKNTVHSAHRGKAGKRAVEVLLINGASYAERGPS